MKSRIFCIFVNISSHNELFLYKNNDFLNKDTIDAIVNYFDNGDIRERLVSPKSESVRRERLSAYSALLYLTEQIYGVLPKISFESEKPKFSEELILPCKGSRIPKFNISHSSTLALICLSDGCSVGCDIQVGFSLDRAKRIGERLINERADLLSPSLPLIPDLGKSDDNELFRDFEIVHGYFDSTDGVLVPLDSKRRTPLQFFDSAAEFSQRYGIEKNSFDASAVLKSWCTLESILKCIGGGFGSLSALRDSVGSITTLGSYLDYNGRGYYVSVSASPLEGQKR